MIGVDPPSVWTALLKWNNRWYLGTVAQELKHALDDLSYPPGEWGKAYAKADADFLAANGKLVTEKPDLEDDLAHNQNPFEQSAERIAQRVWTAGHGAHVCTW